MILSLYQIGTGTRTYTYKARVVTEGTFFAPPAIVSLMYAPEIYGMSSVQTVKIDKESKFTPKNLGDLTRKAAEIFANNIVTILELAAGLLVLILAALLLIVKQRGITLVKIKEKIKSMFTHDKNTPPGNSQDNQTNSIDQTPPVQNGQ